VRERPTCRRDGWLCRRRRRIEAERQRTLAACEIRQRRVQIGKAGGVGQRQTQRKDGSGVVERSARSTQTQRQWARNGRRSWIGAHTEHSNTCITAYKTQPRPLHKHFYEFIMFGTALIFPFFAFCALFHSVYFLLFQSLFSVVAIYVHQLLINL